MSEHNKKEKQAVKKDTLPFWKMFLSVFQAGFGVQNRKNNSANSKKAP